MGSTANKVAGWGVVQSLKKNIFHDSDMSEKKDLKW